MATTKKTTKKTSEVFMASKEYTELKKEVANLDKNMSKVCNKLDKVHNAIVGDLSLGQEGLVRMVKNHQKFIEGQKYMYAKIYGGTIVVATLVSLLAKFWDKLF